MENFFTEIVIGIIVSIIVAMLGSGGRKSSVTVNGGFEIKRTGKKLIILSAIIFFGGLLLITNNINPNGEIITTNLKFWVGASLTGLGVIFYPIGKMIAWYQKI